MIKEGWKRCDIMSPMLKRYKEKVKKFLKSEKKKHYIPLILAIFIFIAGFFLIWASTLKIPNLASVEERRVSESTKIFDRTGKILLYDVNQNTKRTIVPFNEISRNVKNATIAIEDKEFYTHKGFKPTAFLRAVIVNITTASFSQGGSTITQQVVKNSLLRGDKTIARKLKEIVLALKLERVLTKDEILNLYLNEIPYGGSMYGIEEASQSFFAKKSSDLSLAESAYLAAIPKAPTYYSPYGRHRDALEDRQKLVLREMKNNNFISEEEYKDAIAQTVEFKPRQTSSIKAPHFVFYVLDKLVETYGEDALQNDGLRVNTTLDFDIQSFAEEIAGQYALENKGKFNAENAAFVAIDPKTGDLLSMVGSRNYFDEEIDGNFNIATAQRQPGSTFKPFVYAEAFIKGYTPETVLFDVKTQFAANCAPDNTTSEDGCYSPGNYDEKFRGPMTLRESLAQSINITSVKTLYLAGIKDSINLARNMGISTLESSDRYGLTLVLGGGEVSLLDMVSAYGVFANSGVRNEPRAILSVTDKAGNVLEEADSSPTEVLPENIALKISDVLSDNVARAPAFGESSFLHFPQRDVAVKTGTTNDYRDAWIIGYTPSIVLGAWAGNNDNSPMDKKVAGFIVAPMWRALMDKILPRVAVETFPPSNPETSLLKPVLRGKWQGGISSLDNPNPAGGNSQQNTETLTGGVHSILYWVDKDDPRGPAPLRPESDPQFNNWEYGVRRWADQNGYGSISNFSSPYTNYSQNSFNLVIESPSQNSSFSKDDTINVKVRASDQTKAYSFRFYVNGNLVGVSSDGLFSFRPRDIQSLGNKNLLKVIANDNFGGSSTSEVNFDLI